MFSVIPPPEAFSKSDSVTSPAATLPPSLTSDLEIPSFLGKSLNKSLLLLLLCVLSHVQLLATPQTVAHQAPLSMGFSRREYWSRLPFPSPGEVPDQGWNSGLSPAFAGRFFTTEPPGKALMGELMRYESAPPLSSCAHLRCPGG